MDLKLGHSCPSEPYHASIFVFLAGWDNLSIPWGPRQNGWDHLTPDHQCGIWGMALSLYCAHPMGEVSSLNCVYLLAPCRENLPINCMLILSVNDPMIFCCFIFKPPPQPLEKLINFSPSLLITPSLLPGKKIFLAAAMHLDLQVPNTYT